jgi:hypothetical protein
MSKWWFMTACMVHYDKFTEYYNIPLVDYR